MKLHREELAAQSSPEAGFKERTQSVHRAKHQSHASSLAVLGAPHRRGARGASALMAWSKRLKASVWFDVLKKVTLGTGALVLIAYLGHRAESDERHGPTLFTGSEKEQKSGADASTLVTAPSLPMTEVPSEATHAAEPPVPVSVAPCQKGSTASGPAGVTKDGLVILNEATADEMTLLPSVGPARARAILELRERLGRFKKISDLLRIRGIGWKTLEKMKDKAILDRPVETPAVEQEPAPELAPAPARNSHAGGVGSERRMARADVKAAE